MKPRKSFTDEGIQHAWDATSVDLASTCLRKYYYTMVRQIKPKTQSVHLIFGGIYASALESFYKKRALGASTRPPCAKSSTRPSSHRGTPSAALPSRSRTTRKPDPT
jgi:hypothetical protein